MTYPGHEFEQDLDSLLYAAYAQGREDEREDMRRELIERMQSCISNTAGDRCAFCEAYLSLLVMLSKPVAQSK